MADQFTILDVIAQNESGGNASAVKFEQSTFARMSGGALAWTRGAQTVISRLHDCDDATAMALASTSWGTYQIMGFNLWDATTCGFGGTLGTFLSSPDEQNKAVTRFLASARISDITVSDLENDVDKRNHFISRYNGPGDIPSYWALTQRSIAYLRSRQS